MSWRESDPSDFAIEGKSFGILLVNVLGQEIAVIAEEEYAAGTHLATFDASVLPSGMYLYRLSAGQMSEVRSMMLVK